MDLHVEHGSTANGRDGTDGISDHAIATGCDASCTCRALLSDPLLLGGASKATRSAEVDGGLDGTAGSGQVSLPRCWI